MCQKKETIIHCPQSSALAYQAMLEIHETGKIQTVCPKCKTTLKISMSERGERTYVKCDCGYVYYCEINL